METHSNERVEGPLDYPIIQSRSKVENYRGITLLSVLGKLFTSILNNRLYDYMVQKGILKAEQGGFRKMHGTVDIIFTLKMLSQRSTEVYSFPASLTLENLRLYTSTKTIRQAEKGRCASAFPRRFNIHEFK